MLQAHHEDKGPHQEQHFDLLLVEVTPGPRKSLRVWMGQAWCISPSSPQHEPNNCSETRLGTCPKKEPCSWPDSEGSLSDGSVLTWVESHAVTRCPSPVPSPLTRSPCRSPHAQPSACCLSTLAIWCAQNHRHRMLVPSVFPINHHPKTG